MPVAKKRHNQALKEDLLPDDDFRCFRKHLVDELTLLFDFFGE